MNRPQSGGMDLVTTVERLLPTPTVQAAKHGATRDVTANAHGHNLWDIPHLLPTPTTVMASGGNKTRGGDRSDELLLGGILRDPSAFGAYADAVARHTQVIGRPPPPPAESRRLNPGFVEWMMMLPEGWVTGLDLTRTAQLRLLGNGVVPLQAATAILSLAR